MLENIEEWWCTCNIYQKLAVRFGYPNSFGRRGLFGVTAILRAQQETYLLQPSLATSKTKVKNKPYIHEPKSVVVLRLNR